MLATACSRGAHSTGPLRSSCPPTDLPTGGGESAVAGCVPVVDPSLYWSRGACRVDRAPVPPAVSLVPGARHVIATESEHYIQLSQPDPVIDATRAVVDAVRRGDSRIGNGELADTGGPAGSCSPSPSPWPGLGSACGSSRPRPPAATSNARREDLPGRQRRLTGAADGEAGECSLTQATPIRHGHAPTPRSLILTAGQRLATDRRAGAHGNAALLVP